MPELSEISQAALDAIAEVTEAELAKVDAWWTDQVAPEPEPPDPEPFSVTTIGMSAEANLWDQRLASVGPEGVTARRIFAMLDSNGRDQGDLITDAYHAGMLPVVSYKVPNVANAIKGSYDAWAEAAALYLDSFGLPCIVAIWHEPHGDMTPEQFVDLQERLLPIFKRGYLIPGPILNGWLLDRRSDDFWSYTSPKLLDTVWEFVGIDTYQPAEFEPGDPIPGDRIIALLELLDDHGYTTMRVGVGEYNGMEADAIERSGEIFLREPRCRFACMWNSAADPGSGYEPLEGDRLEAFKGTKADERARQGWAAGA